MSSVKKVKFKCDYGLFEMLYFKGEHVYIENESHRKGGRFQDLWRVYSIDRKYLGDINCYSFDHPAFSNK